MNETTRALRRQGLSWVTYCVVPTAGDMTRILARKRAGTNPTEKRILGHRHTTIVEVRRIHEARKRAGPAPLVSLYIWISLYIWYPYLYIYIYMYVGYHYIYGYPYI